MKRVFLDTNIIVDLLMQREGVVASAKVLTKAKKEGALLVSVLTIANIAYILRKALTGKALGRVVLTNLELRRSNHEISNHEGSYKNERVCH